MTTNERLEFMKSFWLRIELVRKELKLNQKDFASSIDMDANQYSLAKKRCAEIRISLVSKIIDLYGVDANWLFSGKASKRIDTITMSKLKSISESLNDIIT